MIGEGCRLHVFRNGTTNGAEWYPVAGGMQDYNYLYSNCMDITVELGCCKFVAEEELDGKWEENRKSLIKYMMQVHQGVKGHVKDKDGNFISGAEVLVKDMRYMKISLVLKACVNIIFGITKRLFLLFDKIQLQIFFL